MRLFGKLRNRALREISLFCANVSTILQSNYLTQFRINEMSNPCFNFVQVLMMHGSTRNISI